jgi:hypothetical protein
MRTKTILLSALLGAIGSVSVMAQTNVYSLNAVGYVNVSVPPGFSILTCPLITSPDNTMNTLMNNGAGGPYGAGAFNGCTVYLWSPAINNYLTDNGEAIGSNAKTQTPNTNGWVNNATNVLAPGVGAWFDNATTNTFTLTFVGTVPTGSITNLLTPGFTLVGSAVPTSGDLISNSLSTLTNYNVGDQIYTWSPAITNYIVYASSTNTKQSGYGDGGHWSSFGDPTLTNVSEGFWYENNSGSTTVQWVENYSVSQ